VLLPVLNPNAQVCLVGASKPGGEIDTVSGAPTNGILSFDDTLFDFPNAGEGAMSKIPLAKATGGGYFKPSGELQITPSKYYNITWAEEDKLTFTDEDGDLFTVQKTGPGAFAVVLADADDDGKGAIDQIVVEGGDAWETTLTIKVIKKAKGGDGMVAIGEVHADTLRSISAPKSVLLGDITVTGTLGLLQLNSVGGSQSTITIGPAKTARQTVVLQLGQISDLSISSQAPIQSITSTQWLDTDAVADLITAPWLGTLSIKGDKRQGIAGNFEASTTLSGMGAARYTLSSATVLGDVSGSTWDITGNVGTIDIRGKVIDWTLGVHSGVQTLKLGDVAKADVTIQGAIGTVTAKRWQAGQIQANSLGTLNVTGVAATTGSPAVRGDFGADLTLLGQGLASTASTLGTATIKGNVGANAWDVKGKVGSVAVGGAVGTADSAWQLKNATAITTLKLGDVANTSVSVDGAVGLVQAIRWQTGLLAAASVGTAKTTGMRGDARLGIAAIPGDWGADVTLSGVGATRYTLGTAQIAGGADGTWEVTGHGNSVKVGSSAVTWDVTFTGNVASVTSNGDLSGRFEANSIGTVSAKNITDAEFNLNQVPDPKLLALKTMTAKEWMTAVRVLSAGNIGSVSALGMANSSVFAGVLATHDTNGDGVLDLPNPATELDLTAAGRAFIKSVRVSGVRGADRQYADSLINSNLAAAEFGSVYLGYVRTANSGVPFGLAADHIQMLTTRDKEGTAVFRNLALPGDSGVWDDAEVRVI
jgi:hypothetical protein